jgi:hypothetical protein
MLCKFFIQTPKMKETNPDNCKPSQLLSNKQSKELLKFQALVRYVKVIVMDSMEKSLLLQSGLTNKMSS